MDWLDRLSLQYSAEIETKSAVQNRTLGVQNEKSYMINGDVEIEQLYSTNL